MKYFIFFIPFLFIGCSYKTTPVIIGFKKNNFSINDQAFLKENRFAKKIEVYNVGKLIFVLTIKDKYICINKQCYSKKLFIKNLNPTYPINLFSLIIDKKPLPNMKIKKTKNGFIQKNRDFYYIVTKNKSLFKDKKTKFLFFLKKN